MEYLIPFYKQQGSADYVCFGPDNKLYAWSHEEPDKTSSLDQTFFEFLLGAAKELMENKNKMKERNVLEK
jgi:hypothetical protein